MVNPENITLSVLKLLQIKVSLLKNAKNLEKLLKIREICFTKKLDSLIVRMRTNRGSTVCFFEEPFRVYRGLKSENSHMTYFKDGITKMF